MAVAAYAAVVSLIHVLDNVQHPARRRLHLDAHRIETLREKVSFLQDFLELYPQIKSKEIENLAMQISSVAVEAEDVIDIHVVDQLRAISVDESGRALSLFCEDIDRVIEKIESIKKVLMMVKEGMAGQEQQPRVCVPVVSTARPSISSGQNTMVGFDEHLIRIMDVLTNTGYKSDLQLLPIVGMGGIGKTTLARNVFDHPCIEHHFHVRVWVTISQEYSKDEILLSLLQDLGIFVDQENNESGEDLAERGEKLYKSLSGRRYLIVMDDLWGPEAWHDLMLFFPDNRNGSRLLVTTRLLNVAVSLGSHNPYLMDFLDEDQSWKLLSEKAFAQEGCPPELEEIGRKIARSCRGPPLAIVVIGGLLSASNMTRDYWEFVAENVNSFANSENDEYCLKILSLSYNHLPIHLKPCFLYMGVFSKVDQIGRVNTLISLWVAQGFLKPINDKTLEEVAHEYLMDLVDRNLILIPKRMNRGKAKTCSIHDLLRDLCHRELQTENLLNVPKMQNTCITKPKYRSKPKYGCFLCNGLHTCRRISLSQVIAASQATSPASCYVCQICRSMYPQLHAVRLVRVINAVDGRFSKGILHPTKLRYLSLKVQRAIPFEFVSPSMPLLWNLQTVIIQKRGLPKTMLPSEIWEMPLLRHLMVTEAFLCDPVVTQIDQPDSTVILENLRTLSTILNFKFSEEVLERIPNLKELRIRYYETGNMEWSHYSLHNLAHLHKLESLYVDWKLGSLFLREMTFPHSLKELTLSQCKIPWEEMTIIGSLPNLEMLRLYNSAFKGPVWSPTEGEFLKLKLLLISGCDIAHWRVEKIHFPNLESLVLQRMHSLAEIPAGIGEIETLRLIDLFKCNESTVNSAKEILEEQENFGIEGLQLHVRNILRRS